MKKVEKNYSPGLAKQSAERILDEPILKFGYPKIDDEDDDDDDFDDGDLPDFSSLLNLSQKNPFSRISADLYNADYKKRIIVIDEQIDQKCFIYAKMIENWNREDAKIFDVQERINKLIEKVPEADFIFKGVKLEKSDAKYVEAKKQESGKKIDELTVKYPELARILVDCDKMKISNLAILDYKPDPIKIKFNSPGGGSLLIRLCQM